MTGTTTTALLVLLLLLFFTDSNSFSLTADISPTIRRYIDPDDMLNISKKYKDKINVVFGDDKGWKRVKNVGMFSHQNFDQFFDWFVLTPTIDAVCDVVTASNTGSKKQRSNDVKKQVRRRQSRMTKLKAREAKQGE